jgi:tripartite-type tricarboxylate transporter receptor subunit TctC
MRPLSRATVGVAVRGTHACRRCYGSGKQAGTEDDTVNNRRYFTFLTVAAAVASVVALHDAEAQDWPSRPVTMVVPFAAGSASDTMARILGVRLSEILGQQVVIENVSGAGGMTGVARVAKAAPDGYQFVLGGVDTFAQNQTLYKKPLYSSATDFTPVALVVEQALLLVARNDLPANNLQEFIAYAKANQAKMQYGSAGVGSGSHLACAQLNSAMGVDVTHVPYRGSPPAMQDLIAGRIDYFCALAAAGKAQIESKTMKAIAILTRDRSPILPNLASAHEQGLADFDSYFWRRLFPAEGHARADRPEAPRCDDCNHEHACGAGASEGSRSDGCRGRPSIGGLSAEIRGERNREVGRHDQGERRQHRLTCGTGELLANMSCE